ncbi:MAG: YiiD C-terminal domain-containing protein [Flavobacteriales bacterium]|nr:YiiD C-terminal domain-containing protein [Flavobacteriales bacterium]
MSPKKILQQANFFLRTIGLRQIPLIYYVGARVVETTDRKTVLRIPLNRRTKNHLGSMYFGALAIGADVTGAWVAFQLLQQSKQEVSIVFKDLKAEFLMRPEGDVHFTCTDSRAIREAFAATIADGKRKNLPVRVIATVPSKTGDQPVAKFELTLSAKCQKG